MQAEEVDVNYPQPDGQADGTVDGIADGIMDLLDNTAPNDAGVVTPKEPDSPATTVTPTATISATVETPPTPKQDKHVIKWQGQDKEVTQDELISLAQQGYDYTQKTQALADERNQLAPYQGLANVIKADPVKAAQIAAIISGQAPVVPQAETKPTFDDPIEQLKWETKQEALAEIRQEMQQQIVPMQRMQALNQVKAQIQVDPDYKEVHQAIVDSIKAQPPAIQKTMYMQLDQDPAAYMDAFQFHKTQLASRKTTATPATA